MPDAVAFYESIGFDVIMYDDGYAWIHYEDGELFHLALVPELDPSANAAAGYFHVPDVSAWHKRISATHPDTSTLDDTPWNMREFSIKDPSGNLLRFGSNLD
ncbi:MAG: VOC family protein [Acidimicrobiales bacterium]|nr:VOC family protein [Acidimicrobiales bacterium]